MIRIGVVIPTLNNFRGLAETLESIKTRHAWTPYIQPNWRNKYCLAKAWNNGISQALDDECKYILVLNDDIYMGRFSVDNMIEEMQSGWAMVTGSDVRDRTTSEEFLASGHKLADSSLTLNPNFACFMLTEDSYYDIGPFDENFRPAYFEDNDYHYRIKLAKQEAVHSGMAPFYHFGSVTQNMDPNNPVVPSPQFECNRQYYYTKWGGLPGLEQYTSPYNDKSFTHKDWIHD